LKKAQAGDESVLPELRALFNAVGSPYAESLGNMAALVEAGLLSSVYGTNLAFREAVKLKLSRLREELGGHDPSPIVRLLADRAAFCWLTLYAYER
jgi:hypothetical protein